MEERFAGNLPEVDRDERGLLRDISLFALDMDGTVYLDETWIEGAKEFLARITERGKRYVFLTNNSSKDPGTYVEKLARMGLAITRDQILTSADVTIDYCRRTYPGARVCLLGNRLLAGQFEEAGITLDDEAPDVCVLGFDTELTYEKLCVFCAHVRSGLPYIATHPDFNCPTKDGFIPDAGAMMALVEASTGRRADLVIGKPSARMGAFLLTRNPGLSPDRVAMVGDRLYTDIAAGRAAGFVSVLVLSGEATMADAEKSAAGGIRPDLIYTSVARMPV